MAIQFKKANQEDHEVVMNIWVDSARATHHFLKEDDFLSIEDKLRTIYLHQIKDLWLISVEGEMVGFLGMDENKVEMLFIHSSAMKKGLGRAALDFARTRCSDLLVDVNEQNESGVKFYLHYGFEIIGRSEMDGEGMPYPLLHLKLSS